MEKEVRLFYSWTSKTLQIMDRETYKVYDVVLKIDGPPTEIHGGAERLEPDIKVDVLPRY